MFDKVEKGQLEEGLSAIDFELFFKAAANASKIKGTIEDLYSDSEQLKELVFEMIDGFRRNPGFDSSRYVAIKFNNILPADMFKNWDFGKYDHKVEFYVLEDLTSVVLVVYT